MFTREELNILRESCGKYDGCFAGHKLKSLTSEELKRHYDSITKSRELAQRFEDILMDYYSIETSIHK